MKNDRKKNQNNSSTSHVSESIEWHIGKLYEKERMKVSTFYFYQTVQPFEPFNTLKWAHARSLAHSDARAALEYWHEIRCHFFPFHRHYWHTSLHVVILEVGLIAFKLEIALVDHCSANQNRFGSLESLTLLSDLNGWNGREWQLNPQAQANASLPIWRLLSNHCNSEFKYFNDIHLICSICVCRCFAYSTTVFRAHQREMMRNSRDLPKSAWEQSQSVLNQFTAFLQLLPWRKCQCFRKTLKTERYLWS